MKAVTLTLCVALCVLLLVVPARAQRWNDTPEEIAKDLDRAKEKVKELERTVEQIKRDAGSSSITVVHETDWGSEIDKLRERIDGLEREKLRERIDGLERENLHLRQMLAASLGPAAPRRPEGVKPPAGTAARLHEDVVEKATALRLTAPLISDPQRKQALEDFETWTREAGIVGSSIDWPVTLIQVSDLQDETFVGALERIRTCREELDRANTDLAKTRGRKTSWQNPLATRQQDIKAEEQRVRICEQSLKDAMAALQEEKDHPVEVIVSVPEQPDVVIVARVHKDDREFVGGLPLFSTFRLRGGIGRIRCERDRFGKTTFPIELIRCRATKP